MKKISDKTYQDGDKIYCLRDGQTIEELLVELEQEDEVTEPTTEERFDKMFPKTDTAQVLFEALFELSNRIMTLEGKKEITREQLKDWLKSKLPE